LQLIKPFSFLSYQIAVPGPVPKSSIDWGRKSVIRVAISLKTLVIAAYVDGKTPAA
jgi:hypothetical protein